MPLSAKQCFAQGEGLPKEGTVFVNQATSFKIQTYKQTGGQKFKVSIVRKKDETKPKRAGGSAAKAPRAESDCDDVSVVQEDLQNGSYSVWYSLPSAGMYVIAITTAGENIKGSPFHISGTEQ